MIYGFASIHSRHTCFSSARCFFNSNLCAWDLDRALQYICQLFKIVSFVSILSSFPPSDKAKNEHRKGF